MMENTSTFRSSENGRQKPYKTCGFGAEGSKTIIKPSLFGPLRFRGPKLALLMPKAILKHLYLRFLFGGEKYCVFPENGNEFWGGFGKVRISWQRRRLAENAYKTCGFSTLSERVQKSLYNFFFACSKMMENTGTFRSSENGCQKPY